MSDLDRLIPLCFPTGCKSIRKVCYSITSLSCWFVAAEGEGRPTAHSRELDDLTTGAQHWGGRTPNVSIRWHPTVCNSSNVACHLKHGVDLLTYVLRETIC